jgi:uncharacterized protein (DUF362 family)
MNHGTGRLQPQVALSQGEGVHDGRYSNVSQALDLLADDIDLAGKKRVLVKPNFVTTNNPLACTHVDAVRAVLDFVRARYNGPLTIAEGPSVEPAADAFRLLGYEPLAHTYDATLADLNHDKSLPVDVYNWRLQPLRLHLARSVVESDFRISIGPPKTHDAVIVTLSLKNMIMGSLISQFSHDAGANNGGGNRRTGGPIGKVSKLVWRMTPQWVRRLPPLEWTQFRVMSSLEPSDKMRMHQSYKVINLNLALLAPRVVPHLAVIDGWEAMEGNGPSAGTPVPWRVALASTDALAADTVGATLMGFPVDQVGYLYYCKRMGLGAGDLSQIEIVGNRTVAECSRSFRPHATYRRQRQWEMRQVETYLSSHPTPDLQE